MSTGPSSANASADAIQDNKVGSSFDLLRNVSVPDARSPNKLFVQSLIDEGPPGINVLLDTVFVYLASHTKFFSGTYFKINLEGLNTKLNNLHTTFFATWQQEMFKAVDSNDFDKIRKLIYVNGFDINEEIGPVIPDGNEVITAKHTALTWACWRGNLAAVKYLIKADADPCAVTSEDLSPLNFASMKDTSLPVLKYLVENQYNPADVNYCGEHKKYSALISACAHGSYAAAQYLLGKGVNINHEDWKGMIALHHATIGGHFEIIKLLIHKKTCWYLRDDDMANVLHHLIQNHKNFAGRTFIQCLKFLIEEASMGVKLKIYNNGATALHEVCSLGLFEATKFLLEHGADIEAKTNTQITPLWCLVMGKCPKRRLHDMVMILMENGANFDTRNCMGMTMLEYARNVSGSVTLVKCLEEVQRMRKMKRLKALVDRRRKILLSTPTVEKIIRKNAKENSNHSAPIAARTRMKTSLGLTKDVRNEPRGKRWSTSPSTIQQIQCSGSEKRRSYSRTISSDSDSAIVDDDETESISSYDVAEEGNTNEVKGTGSGSAQDSESDTDYGESETSSSSDDDPEEEDVFQQLEKVVKSENQQEWQENQDRQELNEWGAEGSNGYEWENEEGESEAENYDQIDEQTCEERDEEKWDDENNGNEGVEGEMTGEEDMESHGEEKNKSVEYNPFFEGNEINNEYEDISSATDLSDDSSDEVMIIKEIRKVKVGREREVEIVDLDADEGRSRRKRSFEQVQFHAEANVGTNSSPPTKKVKRANNS